MAMEETKKKEPNQFTEEELKTIVDELSRENKMLTRRLQQMDFTSFFLSMLFKVMEHPDKYSEEFVSWSAKNIEGALYSFVEASEGQEEKDENK